MKGGRAESNEKMEPNQRSGPKRLISQQKRRLLPRMSFFTPRDTGCLPKQNGNTLQETVVFGPECSILDRATLTRLRGIATTQVHIRSP